MPAPTFDKPAGTVLITRCSEEGIGSALAQAFNDRGFHVFATARSLSKMTHLEQVPHIALLELFNVNFWGMVQVTHTFMPLLIASRGTLINNASLAGIFNMPWGSFYNASKSAVRMYSESLRVEVAPLGVKVVTIMTGIVATKMFDNAPQASLPETLYYKSASKQIEQLASDERFASTAMPAAVYAKGVVDDVLRRHSGMAWRGKIASLGWFIHSFFPTWLADRAFGAGSGLEKI
ncbi:hypothetical protein BDV12DRAFT_206731 [Aspergillus spectabilis]